MATVLELSLESNRKSFRMTLWIVALEEGDGKGEPCSEPCSGTGCQKVGLHHVCIIQDVANIGVGGGQHQGVSGEIWRGSFW